MTTPPKLWAGQVWAYRTRPEDEGSRLTVLKVETVPEVGDVVHVALDGLRLPNPVHPERHNSHLPHVPISADALSPCLCRLVGDVGVDRLDLSGYHVWREHEGGVFTIGVADVVQGIAESLRR